ncbi:hypothetical protein J437_LFUL014356 [Ladona fulva]|uniref:RRM domain-containing protein n=1 Tax=Ladona fulva TaxID=123851 RepID=A0A8K0PAR6_LADFU|nr:hypothetical protein J437_LFUL014356 [Ladona fulva]
MAVSRKLRVSLQSPPFGTRVEEADVLWRPRGAILSRNRTVYRLDSVKCAKRRPSSTFRSLQSLSLLKLLERIPPDLISLKTSAQEVNRSKGSSSSALSEAWGKPATDCPSTDTSGGSPSSGPLFFEAPKMLMPGSALPPGAEAAVAAAAAAALEASNSSSPSSSLAGGVQQKDTTWTKLFVGGLPYHTTDKSLREHFSVYGDIEEAVVITDRQTGKSRGYGFVIMGDRSAAERACKEPNPIIDGRKANVNLAILGAKPRGNLTPGSHWLLGSFL